MVIDNDNDRSATFWALICRELVRAFAQAETVDKNTIAVKFEGVEFHISLITSIDGNPDMGDVVDWVYKCYNAGMDLHLRLA